MLYKTSNPTNGQSLAEYKSSSIQDINSVLSLLKEHQYAWRRLSIEKRAQSIGRIGHLLIQEIDWCSRTITDEMGKTLKESVDEVKKCAALCDYYANHAYKYLFSEKITYQETHAKRFFSPLGIVYSITPWNFPFWQVFRANIANLLIGNAVLLKHAENVIGCGQVIEKIITQAIKFEVFKSIIIDLNLSQHIIAHPNIAAISFTGSSKIGAIVAKQSGEVCKKCILELGGSDPYIIRADADIDIAAKTIVKARMLNAGQVCVSPKRLIVDKNIASVFQGSILEYTQKIRVGNPCDFQITMGPLAKKNIRDNICRQVDQSIRQGAKRIWQHEGDIYSESGFYYPPTILTHVTPNMPAFDEELFGPVIVIISSSCDEEALSLANTSPYGLGGGIFTQNISVGQKIAQQMEVGMCSINQCIASHPAIPFGGVKLSGYGRECSLESMREFVNIKTLCIKI